MTYTSLIRLGPIATPEMILGDARRDGRILYDRMDLGVNPRVLIDHDDDKVVGRVRQLLRHPDSPWGLWLAALCDIDVPPLWLKRGTACSFGFAPLHRQEYAGWQIVRRGLVNEISLLSPSVQPAEPLAQVLTFSSSVPPKTDPAAATASRHAAAAGTAAHGEVILGGGLIRRPGVGRVIAVR